ncbi:ferrichrome-iron receptor domain protein [Escherichia coli P0299917.1]|nr:ferrichrome-iron receptor domain protein [Escherichia coli P0299917.1]
MARSKTAQPKHSLRKIAVVVATAVSGMSVYAQAAVEPKEDTITVTAAPRRKKAHGGLLQLLRRDSLLPALKPIRRFKKCHSLFLL